MKDVLRNVSRTVWMLAGIAILVGAVFGIAWLAQQLPPSVSFIIPRASCNFAASDETANYSATIIEEQNYDATAKSVAGLIEKYGGDLLSDNTYEQPYQNDASGASYTNIHSTYINGTIPVGESKAFMGDVAALAPSSSSLNSVSYSKTTGDQLNQSCMDLSNSIKSSEALAQLYLREMPLYLKENKMPDAPSTNYYSYPNSGYSNYGGTNLDDFNNQIQNSYQNISSDNDSIAQLYQSLNKTTVNITIQDKEQPTYPPAIYPPSYGQPVSNNSPTPLYPPGYGQPVNSSPTNLPTNYQ